MLLAGLYISSLSSSLGTFYGTPRVLQSIASQRVIPVIRFMSKGVSVYTLLSLELNPERLGQLLTLYYYLFSSGDLIACLCMPYS